MNNCIHQGCIQLIKSDRKAICNVAEYFYFNISISYEFLIRQRTLKKIKYINVSTKKIFCKSGNIDIKNNYFLSSK